MAAWAVRPKPAPSREKLLPYECGVDTKGPTWTRLKVNYFKYALVFLLFDVETLFLYPWAVRFRALGWFAFVEMAIFVVILVIGLWYAWKEGALEWE
jgi:NADH-quinone oxidoreductase subunit A